MGKKKGRTLMVYPRGNDVVFLNDFLKDLQKSHRVKKEIQHG